jgi:hypothetical protein
VSVVPGAVLSAADGTAVESARGFGMGEAAAGEGGLAGACRRTTGVREVIECALRLRPPVLVWPVTDVQVRAGNGLRNVSFILRNVSFVLRNVSFVLRNVSFQTGVSFPLLPEESRSSVLVLRDVLVLKPGTTVLQVRI